MKKLMIALAAIAMVGATQAATTNWKFHLGTSGILKDGYIRDKTPGATPAAMANQLFYVLTSDTSVGGISQADLVSAFQGNAATFDLSSYAIDKYDGDSKIGVISGSVNASGKLPSASAITASAKDFTDGNAYNFYMAVVVDADSDGTYDYLYVSADKNAIALDATKTQTVTLAPASSTSYQGTGAYSAAGWYGVGAVPEPTSGLLMLLGMAGLALRRRRA